MKVSTFFSRLLYMCCHLGLWLQIRKEVTPPPFFQVGSHGGNNVASPPISGLSNFQFTCSFLTTLPLCIACAQARLRLLKTPFPFPSNELLRAPRSSLFSVSHLLLFFLGKDFLVSVPSLVLICRRVIDSQDTSGFVVKLFITLCSVRMFCSHFSFYVRVRVKILFFLSLFFFHVHFLFLCFYSFTPLCICDHAS